MKENRESIASAEVSHTVTDSADPALPASALAPVPPPRKLSKVRRGRDQRVKRFKRGLLKVEPSLNDARFSPIINSFARCSILAIDAFDLLRKDGLLDADNEIRSSVQTFTQLIAQQLRFAKALNLTPDTAAKFGEKTIKVLDLESMRDE